MFTPIYTMSELWVCTKYTLVERVTFVPLAWNRVCTTAAGIVPPWSLQLRGKSFIDLCRHNLAMCNLVDIYEDIVEYYVQVRIIFNKQRILIMLVQKEGQFSPNDCL